MLGSPWRHSQKPLLMGVLNCTPDSFSDGGEYLTREKALAHARKMMHLGAAMIDVGGESTRPGSVGVSIQEEIDRIIPVVQQLSAEGIYVSVDTSKPKVMLEAVRAGARMINDVNALAAEGAIAVAMDAQVDVCLMHKKGTPQQMQLRPTYTNVLEEVAAFLRQRMDACILAGISPERILIDPGIGFGKNTHDNLQLQAHLNLFKDMGPVLLGVSRKSFLGDISGSLVSEREFETAAAVGIAVWNGVDVLRVHDIERQKKVVDVAYRLRVARAD